METGVFSSWVATVSTVAGLSLTILNLLFYFRTIAKQKIELEKGRAEVEKQRRELAVLQPRFSVFYVEIREDGWLDLKTELEDRGTKGGFWRFPVLRNEAFEVMASDKSVIEQELECSDQSTNQKLHSGAYANGGRTTVCLVVEQTGKAYARNVNLATKKIAPPSGKCIEVFEADDLNIWAEATTNLGGAVTLEDLRLGDINTGEGLLIPLLVRTHFHESEGSGWFSISSGSITVPLHLTYIDELDDVRKQYEIREMLNTSQQLTARVVTRG